ncbi:PREDICTED: uncharacterized protein LOC109584645 [Amphimedon queenslandica]|uniref:DUF4614 domain-containing protein n=1 Tax=Amphimedon queenslandica TaxID=400682 RepID=A0A1X7U5R2_AMPQE|nr:PREDICTED: uncharacterized protein LOC109584645 [Amphimedon queenslandica]|eukprot:XP_019856021.1 PREDICTED: uncharacterized protein LOC109584645 [Amphimedon queenslandica]
MAANYSSKRPSRGEGGHELSFYLKNTRELIKTGGVGGVSSHAHFKGNEWTKKKEETLSKEELLSDKEETTLSSESNSGSLIEYNKRRTLLNHTHLETVSGRDRSMTSENVESWMESSSDEEENSLLKNVQFQVSDEESDRSADDGRRGLEAGSIVLTINDLMSEDENGKNTKMNFKMESDVSLASKNSTDEYEEESIYSNTQTVTDREEEESIKTDNGDLLADYSSDDFEEDDDDETLVGSSSNLDASTRPHSLPRQPDTLKNIGTQTDGEREVEEKTSFLLPPVDGGHLNTTPLLPHIVRPEALEVLAGYSPALLAIKDLTNSQLALTRHFIARAQCLSDSILTSTQPDHQYVTLDGTQEYIKAHKPKVLSYSEALERVKRKERQQN